MEVCKIFAFQFPVAKLFQLAFSMCCFRSFGCHTKMANPWEILSPRVKSDIYIWRKIYLVNRLETNSRKSLIPFHAIWGLCWYNALLNSHIFLIFFHRQGVQFKVVCCEPRGPARISLELIRHRSHQSRRMRGIYISKNIRINFDI